MLNSIMVTNFRVTNIRVTSIRVTSDRVTNIVVTRTMVRGMMLLLMATAVGELLSQEGGYFLGLLAEVISASQKPEDTDEQRCALEDPPRQKAR
mmetsp:Transcript_2755/g.5721  ORF Transcript_2755/g.5721 Transcript_2755/m.5721 type:complete len:94 (+) Transcript_2755:710-991(+)